MPVNNALIYHVGLIFHSGGDTSTCLRIIRYSLVRGGSHVETGWWSVSFHFMYIHSLCLKNKNDSYLCLYIWCPILWNFVVIEVARKSLGGATPPLRSLTVHYWYDSYFSVLPFLMQNWSRRLKAVYIKFALVNSKTFVRAPSKLSSILPVSTHSLSDIRHLEP